jgi:hypothetical protein
MKCIELFAMALLLAFALPAEAGRAPWYKWQGASGDIVCAQTSPGEGWTRIGAVYVDPRCMRRDNRATENKKAKNGK